MKRKMFASVALLGAMAFSVFGAEVSLQWVGPMEGTHSISAPAIALDGSVYAATDQDALYKFSSDGSLLWKKEILSDPEGKSKCYATPTIDQDGTVYLSAGSSRGMATCVAFRPDGTRKWTFSDFWNKGAAHQASINGGMVAIGSTHVYVGNSGLSGTVLAIDKESGLRKGYIASTYGGPTGGVRSGIVLSGAGMVHWTGGKYGVWGASRARLDRGTHGSLYTWNEYATPNTQATTPNLSALACMKLGGKDCVVGIMTDRNSTKIYALDASNGTQLSLVRIPDTGVQDQGGVVTTVEGYIVAPLNCQDGKENGGIVVVDPLTAEIKGRYRLAERVIGTPAVDQAGNIHFFTESGWYYVLALAEDLILKSKVNVAALLRSDARYSGLYGDMDFAKIWCSTVIGDNGDIYTCFTAAGSRSLAGEGSTSGAGSASDGLAALGSGVLCIRYADCTAPAASDWPMVGGNARHTGCQKEMVFDDREPAPLPKVDATPRKSLLGSVVKKGKTLTQVFDQIIAQQSPRKKVSAGASFTPRKKVYIVAHRANTCAGIAEGRPDNSIAAIEKAIEVGADMVELDVRTTLDGHLVLMHDATIDASTNGSGSVSQFTLAQLRGFSMSRSGMVYTEKGQSVRVPTLAEALLACKGKIYVNLDLKAVADPAELVRVIQETGMQGQVMLFCGGKAAEDYQRRDASIALHPYIGRASDVDAYLPYEAAKLFQYGYYQWVEGDSIAREVRAKGRLTYSNILNYDVQSLSANYLYLDKFIKSEIDFIQTDYCELVASYLYKKGLR